MSRPGWDEYGLGIAQGVSIRADCTRRQVGAALMSPDHSIVATGYNGGPSKGPSCLKGECPRGRFTYDEIAPLSSYDTGAGSCVAIHAEQNALLRASWSQMSNSTLYITCAPCEGCIRMITATHINRVVWIEEQGEDHVIMQATVRAGRFVKSEAKPRQTYV